MITDMSLEQIRFALTVFLLQNEGKSVKETFDWVETKSYYLPNEHNEKIDKEEFSFGLVSIERVERVERNNIDKVTYHRYRSDMTGGRCELIITTKVLVQGEVLYSITLNPGRYTIQVEDIIKHINFKDSI